MRAQDRKLIGLDYEAVMDAIREGLPRDANIVREATVPAYLWGDRLLAVYEPRTSLHPTSAAIRPGLPLAIGAAIGSGRQTVLIAGDGGFMLSLGELATAVQYDVPLVVCLFNDGGYGVLRAIQHGAFEGRTTGVDLATPDFAAVARAMGMHGRERASSGMLSRRPCRPGARRSSTSTWTLSRRWEPSRVRVRDGASIGRCYSAVTSRPRRETAAR